MIFSLRPIVLNIKFWSVSTVWVFAISLRREHTVSGVVGNEVVQCADVVPLHGQGGQWTLNRHIRDETNFVNTVPVSVMQVPGKMSIAGTSYYLASEQLQVFKTYILYICKESDFLVRGCTVYTLHVLCHRGEYMSTNIWNCLSSNLGILKLSVLYDEIKVQLA